MPDHAAWPLTIATAIRNPVHRRLDREILLIAGYFLFLVVENDELINQLQQSLRSQQAVYGFILWRWQALTRLPEALHVSALLFSPFRKQTGFEVLARWSIDQIMQNFILGTLAFFLPPRPEFARRSGRAIQGFILANG